jgi:hypothetical protein
VAYAFPRYERRSNASRVWRPRPDPTPARLAARKTLCTPIKQRIRPQSEAPGTWQGMLKPVRYPASRHCPPASGGRQAVLTVLVSAAFG